MIAFDTDVLVEILRGNPAIVERADCVSPNEQSISIVVMEEILRARLNAIRQMPTNNSGSTSMALKSHALTQPCRVTER
jgi:predicted nucleic acid-binding protein